MKISPSSSFSGINRRCPVVDRYSLLENTRVSDAGSPPVECTDLLRPEDCAIALAEIQTWPGYQSTPLRSLPGMARAAGIGELLYKDGAFVPEF